jgi:hypothetical protein
MRTLAFLSIVRMSLVAPTPSLPGICTSMIVTSGRSSAYFSTASTPSTASATTT